MTPTPPSTTPSSGGHSPEEQFRVVRRRNRVPLSCTPCRTRKKCDRGHPCTNCVKREGADANSCSYALPPSRKKNQSQGATSPDDMQNRIDRLEGLVLALMHGGANVDAASAAAASGPSAALRPAAAGGYSSGPGSGSGRAATTSTMGDSTTSMQGGRSTGASQRRLRDDADGGDDGYEDDDDDDKVQSKMDNDGDSDVDNGLASSLGVLKVDPDKGKSVYIGQEHWHTILADISEVKSYFATHKKDLERSYERVLQSKPLSARDGPTFLLGATPATEVELRAELPPKSSVLTLCSRYFNSMDNAVNIVHAPTFHKMLQNHWQDPSRTSIMWLGLLYSVLCMAMLSYHKVGDEPAEWRGRSLELAAEYRLRTVQCLVAADFTKPCEYTVETMLLYVFGEYSSRWDAELGLWLISALITRVAMRMGYHRDAKWFPSITPFQAEMRRRVWALVRMCDVLFSHQVSLPSMIYDHDCDTGLPTNVFDEEFGPDTKVLPPARARTEPTPMAYMIAKTKLTIEMGAVLQATNRVGRQVPYDEILRLDARLREVAAEMPPHLTLQPLEGSHDPLTLIIARLQIDILIQKIFCLLHRKYLPRSRENPRYAHSRRTAIEAAMDTLRHLEAIHRESSGNGRLRGLRGFMCSIATREFLLPAMLVAMDLHYDNQARQSGERQCSQSLYFWTPQQRMQMVRSLEITRDIWEGLKESSVEAFKACNILRIMLEKITQATGSVDGDGSPEGTSAAADNTNRRSQQQQQQNHLLRPTHLPHPPSAFGGGITENGLGPAPLKSDPLAAISMLSGDMSPNAVAVFDSAQSPRGTSYGPSIDLDMGAGGLAAGQSGNGSSVATTEMTPEFQMDSLGGINSPGNTNNLMSPFSSVMDMGNPMDLTVNFDWDAFENYTQNAHFALETFQFVPTAGDASGGGSTTGSSAFSLNSPASNTQGSRPS